MYRNIHKNPVQIHNSNYGRVFSHFFLAYVLYMLYYVLFTMHLHFNFYIYNVLVSSCSSSFSIALCLIGWIFFLFFSFSTFSFFSCFIFSPFVPCRRLRVCICVFCMLSHSIVSHLIWKLVFSTLHTRHHVKTQLNSTRLNSRSTHTYTYTHTKGC